MMFQELKRVALWSALLFLPIMFFGVYLTAANGGLENELLFPVGLFITLPWVAMHDYLGLGSGPVALLAYPAQFLWSALWIALTRRLIRRTSNEEQSATAK
jgi:hypothetical protein